MFVNVEEDKQIKNLNTICVGHHYTSANTNNINKICVLLQTTGSKDEVMRSYKYFLHISEISTLTYNWMIKSVVKNATTRTHFSDCEPTSLCSFSLKNNKHQFYSLWFDLTEA
jgi:hypothetical protein